MEDTGGEGDGGQRDRSDSLGGGGGGNLEFQEGIEFIR